MISEEVRKELEAVKDSWIQLRQLNSEKKNQVLRHLAKNLVAQMKDLLVANALDVKDNVHQTTAFIDRLTLTSTRIQSMADSLNAVADLPDPVNEVIEEKILENGLKMKRVRAPLGVIFMIFESRPNVAIEAFSMAFKSGNSIILRGGKESRNTVSAIYKLIRDALKENGVNEKIFWGMADYDRKLVDLLLKQRTYIDIVVPRGGAGLIEHVQRESLMSVIKNDRGLCHTYVHEDADLGMALQIVVNAKASRPSVCNALETVLVHEKVAAKFLESLSDGLAPFGMQFFADEKSRKILNAHGVDSELADELSYNTEYLDFKMNVKIVTSLVEALLHIEKFGSKHSEAIVTSDEKSARHFQSFVDAAVVYWNASTRFTDGYEMGLGGEIGISTQKLHVRGPVGLRELTTPRWIVDGSGQVR